MWCGLDGVAVWEQSLNNALRLETYIADAERDGDQELADFFLKAQNESRKGGRARKEAAGRKAVVADGRYTFDSFECGIQKLAPACEHCGCRVIGHGTEVGGHFYCCAHCAREAEDGAPVNDRA